MVRVLVVDDDPTVREVVAGYLSRAGLTVDEAADGMDALARARHTPPDLVVLDLMLPGLDGLEVLRRLRAERGNLPVVLLTARGEESDRVLGLEVGADDYVTKPFSARELVLRVQSILRRATVAPTRAADADLLVDGDLRVDPRARTVGRGGIPLALTSRELDLLIHLLRHPGQAFSRTDLLRQVWGWEYGDESTVTVHVRRLREKVEPDPAAPQRIATVWGVGYRWDAQLAVGSGTAAGMP
ncbi:MAG TPA: response regulator transcription factor [Dermatophilaceae bacterium]|nr:response regulator transcription factor [Dermatophilaceae bacterium]HQG11620.1 response regulator transcription factor [Dermatophilaceae bacterium]